MLDTVTPPKPRPPILALMPSSEDMVTDLYAMTPRQAIEVISEAGADDPATLIRDHSAAGLVRSE